MTKATIGSRRSAVEILYDVLSLAAEGPVYKTRIMYGTQLSYSQLVKYLDFVTRCGLLAHDEDGAYVLTMAGRDTIDRLEVVITLLRRLQDQDAGYHAVAR